jgi:hypothetical protein
MIINNTDREEIQVALTEIEDHVINDVSKRDSNISQKAKRDALDVQEKITK